MGRRALTMYTTMPPYFSPHNLFVKYAEAVKNCPDIHIPVTTVGRISSVEEADKIIGEGKADIVAMARAYLADPEIVKKTYRGEADKVRPCLGCWNCAGSSHHIRCAVNPQMGRTGNYKNILPALKPKKIVIVGGGVAGMTPLRSVPKEATRSCFSKRRDRSEDTCPTLTSCPSREICAGMRNG